MTTWVISVLICVSGTVAAIELRDIEKFAKTLGAHPRQMVLASERVKKEYGIEVFPMSVLLSADNKVEGVLNGFNDKTMQQMKDWLKRQP